MILIRYVMQSAFSIGSVLLAAQAERKEYEDVLSSKWL
jgi:hypothetical protein